MAELHQSLLWNDSYLFWMFKYWFLAQYLLWLDSTCDSFGWLGSLWLRLKGLGITALFEVSLKTYKHQIIRDFGAMPCRMQAFPGALVPQRLALVPACLYSQTGIPCQPLNSDCWAAATPPPGDCVVNAYILLWLKVEVTWLQLTNQHYVRILTLDYTTTTPIVRMGTNLYTKAFLQFMHPFLADSTCMTDMKPTSGCGTSSDRQSPAWLGLLSAALSVYKQLPFVQWYVTLGVIAALYLNSIAV